MQEKGKERMKKVFIFLVMLSTFMLITITPTFAYENVGTQTIYAGIDIQENNDIFFENEGYSFATFKSSLTSWSALMSPTLNYLTIIYDINDSKINIVTVDNIFYTFSNINIIAVYIIYEAPLFLPTFTITLFNNDRQFVYSISNLPVSDVPSFSFLYMGDNQYYNEGYVQGLKDLHNNGSNNYLFDEADSFDYLRGFFNGKNEGVGAGASNFMSDFRKWIVPAILIVIVLGGFITAKRKATGE